jgi:uncharacterized protein YqeY
MAPPTADPAALLRTRLATDLRAAMKARAASSVTTLRCLAAALDNAGAVKQTDAHVPSFGRSGDVPRKSLTQDELLTLLRHEIAARRAAAIEYQRFGRPDDAARLQAELIVIARYLP